MMYEVADESSVALQGMKLGPLGKMFGFSFLNDWGTSRGMVKIGIPNSIAVLGDYPGPQRP